MVDITQRIVEIQRRVERQRFAGDDPTVEISADLGPAEIVARTLAAERAHALLVVDGGEYNPGEDLAERALRGALGALRSWGFAAARIRLDEAAEGSRDPVTQQRIALLKQLTRHLSALVYTPLTEKLRLTLADLDEALKPLDLLDPAERLHYRDEVDRLTALREAAGRDEPFLAASWLLLRAQAALSAGQDEGALVWLLHLATSHPIPEADSYLAALVARARRHVAEQIGLALDPPAGETEKDDPIRPRDLFNALAARLGADLGRDAIQGMNQFALNEWISPDVAEAGNAQPRGGRGKGR